MPVLSDSGAADRSSIASFQKYFTGYYDGILPEDEIRQQYQITATGAIGDRIGHPIANKADTTLTDAARSAPPAALSVSPNQQACRPLSLPETKGRFAVRRI